MKRLFRGIRVHLQEDQCLFKNWFDLLPVYSTLSAVQRWDGDEAGSFSCTRAQDRTDPREYIPAPREQSFPTL